MQPCQRTIAGGDRRPRTQRCRWPCNIWACRTSQLLYEASPHTGQRGQARQTPASTSATRTRHTSRWHGHNTTTCRPRSPDMDPWTYKSRYSKYPRPPGKTWTTKTNHPSGHQMSTTHKNGWSITARCSASWANKTRWTSTLPCDKRPRRAASTGSTEHRTMPPRIKPYGPWLQPYGATSGKYTQQLTHMTCKPNMMPGEIAARLDTARRQLREWHVRQARELAQEQQRYFQNLQPYKSLKHFDTVLGQTGHRGIKAVRLQDSTVTNDSKVVLEEVLNSFLRQHNTEEGELSEYTEELISHLPKLYNRTQRRAMHQTLFAIPELDELLYKLQPGKTPGVDGLLAELYRRLLLNLKRQLAARL